MASPPGAGGSRYAGRVVDPDVRDDGETEPEVELNPSPPLAAAITSSADSAPTEEQASDAPSSPNSTGRGAEVRGKLLAKARAAEQAKNDAPASLEDELEAIGRGPTAIVQESEDFAPGPPSGRAPSNARYLPKLGLASASKQGGGEAAHHWSHFSWWPRPLILASGFVFAPVRCSRTNVRSAPVLAKASPETRLSGRAAGR